MEKVGENGRKVKAIALLFGQFSTFFSKMEKVAENGQTVKAIYSLTFWPIFDLFSKMEKSAEAENGRKVKAIALLFGQFSTCFSKMEKVAENERKVKAIGAPF